MNEYKDLAKEKWVEIEVSHSRKITALGHLLTYT
jgi:hypothetical protein